jgi:hypothetical protein
MTDPQVLLAVQFVALVVIWLAAGRRAVLSYLGVVLFVWLLALGLNSVHIPLALHMLWVAPTVLAARAISNGVRARPAKTQETST